TTPPVSPKSAQRLAARFRVVCLQARSARRPFAITARLLASASTGTTTDLTDTLNRKTPASPGLFVLGRASRSFAAAFGQPHAPGNSAVNLKGAFVKSPHSRRR